MDTILFQFRVAHKLTGRTLSVVHPRNQVAVASFYSAHSSLIIYYASLGPFSVRKPVSVAKYAYFKDKTHEEALDKGFGGVEEQDREYEQLGSYFVYEDYRNIHRFFESYKYHRSEKKYDAMIQLDISKCFDSIYTHSLPWAVFGKSQTKFYLEKSKATVAGNFDSVMQRLNHKETNGIVIGPEFSRVFAEIILQSVDNELESRLRRRSNLIHKVDYEAFRYVDDYFVFYNAQSTSLKVLETLQEVLKAKKLGINVEKSKIYGKPIITEITIAKERISSLMNDQVQPTIVEEASITGAAPIGVFTCPVNCNRLIVRYKTTIKEAGVEYGDLLNYTLAISENKVIEICKSYSGSEGIYRDKKRLVNALLAMVEFTFFVYSASPSVNHTVRLCRMLATSVEFLDTKRFPYELKHSLFKYIHDNIIQHLQKGTMSEFREVESLYLLVALSQIGKEYWLPEEVLANHFLLRKTEAGDYERVEYLNHFAITVLLSYIKSKVRYAKIRLFIEAHVVEKLGFIKAHCPSDSEAVMLLLDLLVCPYISSETKTSIADVFGLNSAAQQSVELSNDYWFTAWGDKFDLIKELDAKRSREVY